MSKELSFDELDKVTGGESVFEDKCMVSFSYLNKNKKTRKEVKHGFGTDEAAKAYGERRKAELISAECTFVSYTVQVDDGREDILPQD